MGGQGVTAVIGAGVIGAAVACALARDGREVVLIDRDAPGLAGASYGNVGHIATELVEPLPSPGLLFGFWRQLVAFDGPLDLRLRRLPAMLPWIARFASAAFRREENTRHLAPLIKASRSTLESWLRDIGRTELLRTNGHYEIWLSERAVEKAKAHARAMEALNVPTEVAPPELVRVAARAAGLSEAAAEHAAGVWFPDTGHVADPLEIVRAFAAAAVARGARVYRANVQAIEPRGDGLSVISQPTGDAKQSGDSRSSPQTAESLPSTMSVGAAVICTGPWSRSLLAPLGMNVPMESARGYHVELPGHAPLVDAPVLYADQSVVVTPMSGRLRASTYMEFASIDAPQNPRRPRGLREKVRALGYDCPLDGPSWVGARPVLPDYLPGIGCVPGSPKVFYAVGHQHVGLTLAAVTGDLIADLVAGREPRHDVSAFDLQRFG